MKWPKDYDYDRVPADGGYMRQRWYQTSNPFVETEIEGFVDNDNLWTSNFFGLVANTGTYCVMNDADNNLEYVIGASSLRDGGFPGPHKKEYGDDSGSNGNG